PEPRAAPHPPRPLTSSRLDRHSSPRGGTRRPTVPSRGGQHIFERGGSDMAEIIGRADSVAAMSRSRRARVHDVRRPLIRARQWACGLTPPFIAFSVLVALGISGALDERASQLAQALGSYPLDLAASVFNVIGEVEVTGLVALILAFVWWRRDGRRG